MSLRSGTKGLACLGCLLLFAACSQVEKDWDKAIEFNTVQGFEVYLDRHPVSAHQDEALKKTGELTPPALTFRENGRLRVVTHLDSQRDYQSSPHRVEFSSPGETETIVVVPGPLVVSDVKPGDLTVRAASMEILPEGYCLLEGIEVTRKLTEEERGGVSLEPADIQARLKQALADVKAYQSRFSAPYTILQTGVAATPEEEASFVELMGRLVSLSQQDEPPMRLVIAARIRQLPEPPAASVPDVSWICVPYPVVIAGDLEFSGGLSRVSWNMDPRYTCFVQAPVAGGTVEALSIAGVPIALADGHVANGVLRTKDYGEMKIEVPTEVEFQGIPVMLKMTSSAFRKLQDGILASRNAGDAKKSGA